MSQYVVSSTSIDDQDPNNMTYTGTWKHDHWPTFYDTTETFSGDQGATATVHFWGNAIEYWGNAFDDHGPCDIYLDESYVDTITTYSATRTNPRLLFSRDNLALGDHTLTITVKASSDPNVCEVDRFVVNVTMAMTNTPVTTPSAPSSSSISSILSHTTTNSDSMAMTSTPISAGSSSTALQSLSGSLLAADISLSFPSSGNPVTVTVSIGSDIADASTSKNTSVPTSTIVGAAVGSVAFISVAIILCWWYRRSRRSKIPLPSSYVDESIRKAPLRISTPNTTLITSDDAMSQVGDLPTSNSATSPGYFSPGARTSYMSQISTSDSFFYSPPPAYVAIHRNP